MRQLFRGFHVVVFFAFAAACAHLAAQDSGVRLPVKFTLESDAYVTLVVEDSAGKRVRNLVSETFFLGGEHVVFWDGCDDRDRDESAAANGPYRIPGKVVATGRYRVRGLFRSAIHLRYEMSPYTNGRPPWPTRASSSAWLAQDAPPSAVMFLPGDAEASGQILVGSASQGPGSSLAWLSTAGVKAHGESGVAATLLARDEGVHAAAEVTAYCGGVAGDTLQLSSIAALSKTPIVRPVLPAGYRFADQKEAALSGLAARNGLLIASLPKRRELLFIDAPAAKILGSVKVNDPRGVAFARDGRLLVLSGRNLLVGTIGADLSQSAFAAPIALAGVDDPQQIAVARDGNFYISDRGNNHQVKIFTPEGKFLREIGAAGKPNVGLYEPGHMNNPGGLTVTNAGVLWVAETDFAPKRLSVWSANGELLKAFYGPPQTGGGGCVDSLDVSRFFYADAGGGMEFAFDPGKASREPTTIYYRPSLSADFAASPPVTPLHLSRADYLTNAYTNNRAGGAAVATIWMLRDNVAVPVAAFGNARDWPPFEAQSGSAPGVSAKAFRKHLPPDADLSRDDILFVWSDQSDDGEIDPEEVSCVRRNGIGSVNVMRDLALVTASGDFMTPKRFTRKGAPVYDLARMQELAPTAARESAPDAQPLIAREGWLLLTHAPKASTKSSIAGIKNREIVWTYPSLWPGLADAAKAPVPDRPGELIGSSRVLGPAISPRDSDAGEIWAVNGTRGSIYLFTTDGLFVATLFRDSRTAAPPNPIAIRGMSLDETSLGDGSSWTSITQSTDGSVFVQANGAIVRVTGLESIRRMPEQTLDWPP